MRNVRKAAVAGITALALATSGLSVATADEDSPKAGSSKSFNSSTLGDKLGADEEVTGTGLLGWQQDQNLPAWARIWNIVTILGVIGSVVGLVALPIFNDAKAKGLIR